MKGCWVFVALFAPLWVAAEASACGTCAVGDPTLTVVWFEQPKGERVRTSGTLRHRNDPEVRTR